jgi:hypothetical protein
MTAGRAQYRDAHAAMNDPAATASSKAVTTLGCTSIADAGIDASRQEDLRPVGEQRRDSAHGRQNERKEQDRLRQSEQWRRRQVRQRRREAHPSEMPGNDRRGHGTGHDGRQNFPAQPATPGRQSVQRQSPRQAPTGDEARHA